MSVIIRISTFFPPTPEFRIVNRYQHRDGRLVDYVRGNFTKNPKADAVSKSIGYNEGGSTPTLEMWEAFRGETICGGCVARTSHATYRNGKVNQAWVSGPNFRSGVRWGYCQSCFERESAKLKMKFDHDMAKMAETVRKPFDGGFE